MNIHTPESRLHFRDAVGKEIDRLIAMLDDLDGDPDLEETGDEHDTGVAEGWRQHRPSQFLGNPLEDDEDDDPDEDDGTSEPSLGSPELREWDSQSMWAQGTRSERELENEHGGNVTDEPHDDGACTGPDYEHSLGWANPTFPGDPIWTPHRFVPEGWSMTPDSHDGPLGFTGEGGRAAHAELTKLNKEGRVPYSAVRATASWQHGLAPEPGSLFLRIPQK